MPKRTLRSERSNRGGSSVVVMHSSGGVSGALAGSAIDLNFSNGQYFGVTGSPTTFLTTTRASSKTNLFPTSASGFAYSTFLSGVPAITSGSGLSVEEARTNVLLNSTAPGTQTTASLGTGVYTLWVNGSGSATSSQGTATITGAGAATNGTPNVFTVTVAGTVVVTVGGSLNAFQCELGTFGTSFIVTAGATATRAADVITLTSPPAFGSAYSLFGKGTPQSPTTTPANDQFLVSVDDNTANNRFSLRRANTTGVAYAPSTAAGVAGPGIAQGVWAINTSGKFAAAMAANDQADSFNGSAIVSSAAGALPTGVNTVHLCSNANAGQWNGFIERIALWPTTRISNAQLQAFTT